MRRLPLSLVTVLLLAALHMLVFDRGLGGDGWAGFGLLESIADDGDLWLEDNHRGVMNGLVPGAPGDEGHLVSQYPPGILALDALPFLAGRLLDRLLPAGILADGAELPPVGRVPRGVFLSAAAIVLCRNLAALLGIAWTGLALLRLGVPERTAALASGLAFFGGPMLFYSLVGMTHAPTFALAGLLLWLLAHWRNDRRNEPRPWLALAAGLTVGGAVLVRYSAVALLAPALLAARGWRDRLLVLAGFGAPLLVLPVWWRLLFGAWGMPPYGGSWQITAASPWNVLFAPVHGLFLFHPALLFAAAGLALAARRRLSLEWGLGWTCTAWFLAVAVLHGWWSEWANPGGYGQRFLGDALPALALGFAAWLQPDRRPALQWLRLVPCLAATLAGWVLFFAAVGGLVPPPPPHPWPQRLGEYGVLLREPPGAAALGEALGRASFLLRGLLSR